MTTLCIAIIQRLDTTINGTQAVILTNTPENAKIFHGTIVTLGQETNVDAYICIGDSNDDIQLRQIPPRIIIGTVGSIHGVITRVELDKNDLRLYCLDDAEQLLTYHDGKASFGPTLDSIHEWLPKETQVIAASSAIADDTVETIKGIMTRPVAIAVPEGKENTRGDE
jgi:translation initiation factor 4A